MKFKMMITIFAPVLVLILLLSRATHSASAASGKNGNLHVTKVCPDYKGAAGQFCTITSSNIPEIKVGSKVFYDQAANIPTGMLDSNVILDAGSGNRAVGRCTLDLGTYKGLCRFSDGTGDLAEFRARVDVSLGSGVFYWDGTYSFTSAPAWPR